MEEDGDFHYRALEGKFAFSPCAEAYLKCPYCNLRRKFHILYDLRSDLADISADYVRDMVDSPLRCAHIALLKARLKYPSISVVCSGEFSQLQLYYILLAIVDDLDQDAFYKQLKEGAKLIGVWTVYRSSAPISVTHGSMYPDAQLVITLPDRFIVFSSPSDVVLRSNKIAAAVFDDTRAAANESPVDFDTDEDGQV